MRPIGALFIEPIIKVSEKFSVPRLLLRPQGTLYVELFQCNRNNKGLKLTLYNTMCTDVYRLNQNIKITNKV